MARLIFMSIVFSSVILLLALQASAAPAETLEEHGILCQEGERPHRPHGRPEPDGERPEPDRERPEPDRERWEKERRERMEELRREIDKLRRQAENAKKHGRQEEVRELMEQIKQLERKFSELKRRPGPEGPRPEMPPKMSPEEMEEIKREIENLRREAHKAQEQGDREKAGELMRRAEEMQRKLHRPGSPIPPEREFSEEEIDEVLGWLEENEPETLEKLERLREQNPDAYYHFLREMFEKMRHMEEMKKRDPEAFKRMTEMRRLDRSVWELAGKYKHADTKEARAAIEARLKETLSRLFDLKQAQHKAEIDQLQKEVEKLKEIYQRNQESKETIVKEKLKKLTGKNHDFDW